MNKYVVEEDEQIEVLKVDNTKVRAEQLEKLERLRAERDEEACQAALDALTAAAAREDKEAGDLSQNLLKLSVDAARAKATVGEISYALEKVFGRHEAEIRTLSGVYKEEVGKEGTVSNVQKAIAMADAFEAEEGRRPRIFIAKMGQDGHDRGQKVIASAYADSAWTSTSDRCSRLRPRLHAPQRMLTSMWWVCLPWQQVTSHWCLL